MSQLDQPRVRLDKADGVPLYLQIRDLLKADIADGSYGPGDMLPSEGHLMAQFDVSRTTVRLAVEALSVEGIVHKEQGRGTFIAAKPIFVTPSKLQSFTNELRDLGYSPGTKLLGVSTCECSPWVAQELEVEPQSPVLEVIRLRTASRRPVGLCVSHLNTQQYPELGNLDWSALSLYETIKTLEVTIVGARQYVSADVLSSLDAERLNLQQGSPVLRVRRTAFAGAAERRVPIETVNAVFDAKTYSYYNELVP
jgi:GntR family transcriptional regulator